MIKQTYYMSDYVLHHADILKNKRVLDLACADGQSTQMILDHGATSVSAVEVNEHWVRQARANLQGRADIVLGNITDENIMKHLVDKAQVVTCFGALYHLHDHFRLFETVLRPNIEHVIIETLFGPESPNPEMFWSFEKIDWFDHQKIIPHGSPNLSWIVNCARVLGFDCDWVVPFMAGQDRKNHQQITHEEYVKVAGPDWPAFHDLICSETVPDWLDQEIRTHLGICGRHQRRMLLRLYNRQKVRAVPIDISQTFQWPYF